MEGSLATDLYSHLDLIKKNVLKYSSQTIVQYSTSISEDQTKQLWTELEPQISENIDKEIKKLLEDYKTNENVAKLLQLRKDHKGQPPVCTYSGNPTEDVAMLRNVTAKSLEPQLEKSLLEAQTTSSELYSVYKQLQNNITILDKEITKISAEIKTITNKLSNR